MTPTEELSAWCQELPKIELHAHIHGSIRPSTLEQLLQEDADRNCTEPRCLPPNRSLDECFEMFALVHQVVVSRRALRRIVIEAVEDFARVNVHYLELRSTPRELPLDGASRAAYVEEVVSALDECHARQDLDIHVRLILSINRNQPITMAEETVDLAIEWQKKCPYIVGIDLSGHSERENAEFHLFEAVLARARTAGLKLAVHFAEHHDEAEADHILNFRPDRLGHACCLSKQLYAKMVDLRIPIEICLTSNVHTLARYHDACACSLKNDSGLCICRFEAHPHRLLVSGALENAQDYPLCICTDDQGVLDITLVNEYERAALAFQLDRARLKQIARAAIPMIFDASHRARLQVIFAQ